MHVGCIYQGVIGVANKVCKFSSAALKLILTKFQQLISSHAPIIKIIMIIIIIVIINPCWWGTRIHQPLSGCVVRGDWRETRVIGTGNSDKYLTSWTPANYVSFMRWCLFKNTSACDTWNSLPLTLWEGLHETNHVTSLVTWINKERVSQCPTRLGSKS